MPFIDEAAVATAFLALLALAFAVSLVLRRGPRKEPTHDSEIMLAELRLRVEDATQSCRLMEIRGEPQGFSGIARGTGEGTASYYQTIQFEIFNGANPSPSPPDGAAGKGHERWRCSREAAAAGIAHIDRDDRQQLERVFLVLQSGEGVYEAVYCKAGDFMSTGGGILKLSFNGRHLGIVNFGADGAISNAKNRRVGVARWDGASMTAVLGRRNLELIGPAYAGKAFRLAGRGLGAAELGEDERMLLMCLSVFGHAYRRARRVPKAA